MKLLLNQISKRFDGHFVLDGVSLALEKVHTLVLIGPSGGGKSTLLRIIAGLEYPDAGEVRINDEAVDFQEKSLLRHRRTVGTVFQAFNLFPHLTALQNVTLPLEPRLLLFDEPTSALDPEMTAEVLDLIKQLREEGRDFILVTHEMGFARQVADQLALLVDGRIVESGRVGEVFENPASAASREFLGRVLKY